MHKLCLPLILTLCGVAQGLELPPLPERPLETLRPHPRLMMDDARLAELKARSATDATLKRYVDDVLGQAQEYLEAPELTYDIVGPRLLHVSRGCLKRVYTLAFAWRWTGEAVFAEKTLENVRTVCAFKNWNHSHFLDTAEMGHAVAIAYDWLYPILETADKSLIERAIRKHALEKGFWEYEKWTGWPDSEHNWNQVCNSGLVISALAIAEAAPAEAPRVLQYAHTTYPSALTTLAPDGAWPEGPSYWHYATVYTAYGLWALETALGTDFGLGRFPGMAQTGEFPVYTTGPTGYYLNFADAGERGRRRPMACLFWLARAYDSPFLAAAEHAALREGNATAQHVMWYVPAPETPPPPPALDRFFGGSVPVAVFRSAWEEPDALWLGVKGGFNQVNHGQLDLGNFELDALGVRWVRDLGSDNYNLPGYFDKKPGGARWQYYRMRSVSHSVPLIDGEDQTHDATSHVLDFQAGETPFLLLDLSNAYPAAHKVTRRAGLVDDRRAALISDHFELSAPADITWALVTDAAIALAGDRATLELDGKILRAVVESPADAEFSVESAEQAPPQKENKGVQRLLVRVPAAQGAVEIRVRLSPQWE